MINKRNIFLSTILAIAVVGVVVYFITRPQQQELLPQTFAQLPEKPKLIAEFNHSDVIIRDSLSYEGISPDSARPIYSISFSPTDPSLIASVNGNGTVKLWNINNTKEPIRILRQPGIFPLIRFSPTGKLLACAGSGELILWNVASGKKIKSLKTVSRQFAFTPDGNQLVTVYKGIRLWDIRNPKQIKQVPTPLDDKAHNREVSIWTIDISSDGKWIAIGERAGTVNVWDLQSQQLVSSINTSLFEMDFIKFSPNNKYMVTGGHTREMYFNASIRGYIMWEIPSWQRTGEVLRGHVENLVFSPDGKLCASANNWHDGRGVEIWSTEDGAPVTSLQTEARDVSFSQDGKLFATGSRDGIVRVWELTQSQLDLNDNNNNNVRLIYYLPKGKEPSPNITEKIDKTIRKVQKFYADEMERHGFGRKTFTFETDVNGKAKIYEMDENQAVIHDLQLNDIWLIFVDESKNFSKNFMDNMKKRNTSIRNGRTYYTHFDQTYEFPIIKHVVNDRFRMSDIKGFTGNGSVVNATKKDFDWKSMVYTLKIKFYILHRDHHLPKREKNVLKRVFKGINSTMPWGKDRLKLSKCEAEWLDKSRFFNPSQTFFDNRPDVEMDIIKTDTDSPNFQITASDDDGIHQLQLFVTENSKKHYRLHKHLGCRVLNGKKNAIVEFGISDADITEGEIRMIDMHGNIASRKFTISEKTVEPEKQP